MDESDDLLSIVKELNALGAVVGPTLREVSLGGPKERQVLSEKEINTIMYGIHRDCTACSARSTTEFQLGITPTASSTRTAKKKKAGSNGEGVLASVEYSSIPRAGCDHDREFSVP